MIIDELIKDLKKLSDTKMTLETLETILIQKGFKGNRTDSEKDIKEFLLQGSYQYWLDGQEHDNNPFDVTVYFELLTDIKENIWETKIHINKIESE